MAHIRGFTRHIGAGNQHKPIIGAIQVRVVGHEVGISDELLHHGVPSVLDIHHVAVVHLGADVMIVSSHLGQAHVHVDLRKSGGRGTDPLGAHGDLITDGHEQLVLQSVHLIRRAQNRGLRPLQFVGYVSFGICQSLFADVMLGHQALEGLGDLDIVAEHPIVADPQIADAGFFSFLGFDPLDPALAALHNGAELVHLGAVSVPDHPTLTDGKGRLVHDSRIDQLPNVRQRIDGFRNIPKFLRGSLFRQKGLDIGQSTNALADGPQIPSACRTHADLGDQSLDIEQIGQKGVQILPQHKVTVQFGNGALAAADTGNIGEGMLDKAAQKAGTHGGGGFVQHPQKGSPTLLTQHGFTKLQIPSGGNIHLQKLGGLIQMQLPQEGHVPHLGFGNIGGSRTGGNQCRRIGILHVDAELLLRPGNSLGFHEILRASVLKQTADTLGVKFLQSRQKIRRGIENHLFGGVGGQLVLQLGHHVPATERGSTHVGRGHVRKADARRIPVKDDGSQIVVLGILQKIVLHHGTGSNDPHHLTAHQALGLGGILGLLADGHLVAHGDQLADISLAGVIGHAAHGRPLRLAAVPAGERQGQKLRNQLGIIKKHLVKVAETVKQDKILILFFDIHVLLHHG